MERPVINSDTPIKAQHTFFCHTALLTLCRRYSLVEGSSLSLSKCMRCSLLGIEQRVPDSVFCTCLYCLFCGFFLPPSAPSAALAPAPMRMSHQVPATTTPSVLWSCEKQECDIAPSFRELQYRGGEESPMDVSKKAKECILKDACLI